MQEGVLHRLFITLLPTLLLLLAGCLRLQLLHRLFRRLVAGDVSAGRRCLGKRQPLLPLDGKLLPLLLRLPVVPLPAKHAQKQWRKLRIIRLSWHCALLQCLACYQLSSRGRWHWALCR